MTNGTINKNTKLSVALVIAIVIPIIGGVVAFTNVKAGQKSVEKDVVEIKQKLVPRNEIEIQLKAINEKLDNLLKNGK